MRIICLDLEGVLVPEIWINVAKKTAIPALERTTRDEPDYAKLMDFRIQILKEHNLTLKDIQDVIATMDPFEGAKDFLDAIRSSVQLVILSDTFVQFAKPLMAKLAWPTLLCNELLIDSKGMLSGFKLRQPDGKRTAVEGFQSMNLEVYAAGDSFNDLAMIRKADKGALFHPPQNIIGLNPDLPVFTDYQALYDFLMQGNPQ